MEVDFFEGYYYIFSIVFGGFVDTLNFLQLEDEFFEVKFMRKKVIGQGFLGCRKKYFYQKFIELCYY